MTKAQNIVKDPKAQEAGNKILHKLNGQGFSKQQQERILLTTLKNGYQDVDLAIADLKIKPDLTIEERVNVVLYGKPSSREWDSRGPKEAKVLSGKVLDEGKHKPSRLKGKKTKIHKPKGNAEPPMASERSLATEKQETTLVKDLKEKLGIDNYFDDKAK